VCGHGWAGNIPERNRLAREIIEVLEY
jgi:hypothetical protein